MADRTPRVSGAELAVILVVLAMVAVGLGWECAECGAPTGMLYPRPCGWCDREAP